MKTLLLSLILSLTTLFSSAQNYYRATLAELYTHNQKEDSWDLYQKNSDVNIVIVVEEEYINIQAQSPSFYKIYVNTKEPINSKSFTGSRYIAKDLKKETLLKIDILNHLTTDYIVLSVIDNEKGLNFRYFLTKIK